MSSFFPNQTLNANFLGSESQTNRTVAEDGIQQDDGDPQIEYEEPLQALLNRILEMKESQKRANDNLLRKEGVLASAKNECLKVEEEKEALVAENTDLLAKLNYNKEQNGKNEKKILELRRQVQVVVNYCEKIESSMELSDGKFRHLKSVLETVGDVTKAPSCVELSRTVNLKSEELNILCARFEHETKVQDEEILQLRGQHSERQLELKRVQEEMENLDKKERELEGRFNLVGTKIEEMFNLKESLATRLGEKRQEIAEVKANMDKNKATCAEIDRIKAEMLDGDNRNQQIEESIVEFEIKSKSANENCATLSSDIEKYELSIKENRDQLAQLAAQESLLQETLNKMQNDSNLEQKQFEEKKHLYSKQSELNEQFQEKFNQATQEYDTTVAACNEKQKILDYYTEKEKNLLQDLMKVEQMIETDRNEILKRQQQISNAQETIITNEQQLGDSDPEHQAAIDQINREIKTIEIELIEKQTSMTEEEKIRITKIKSDFELVAKSDEAEIQNLKDQILELMTEHTEKQNSLKELTNTLKKIKEDCKNLAALSEGEKIPVSKVSLPGWSSQPPIWEQAAETSQPRLIPIPRKRRAFDEFSDSSYEGTVLTHADLLRMVKARKERQARKITKK